MFGKYIIIAYRKDIVHHWRQSQRVHETRNVENLTRNQKERLRNEEYSGGFATGRAGGNFLTHLTGGVYKPR